MEQFKFKQPTITLFEAFSGIGTQAMALKRLSKELGFHLDVAGTSEIDKFALRTYNAIHGETLNYGSITDEDFYRAETVTSNSQLYKQAGNAIVVDVLYYIFKQLFEKEE